MPGHVQAHQVHRLMMGLDDTVTEEEVVAAVVSTGVICELCDQWARSKLGASRG